MAGLTRCLRMQTGDALLKSSKPDLYPCDRYVIQRRKKGRKPNSQIPLERLSSYRALSISSRSVLRVFCTIALCCIEEIGFGEVKDTEIHKKTAPALREYDRDFGSTPGVRLSYGS